MITPDPSEDFPKREVRRATDDGDRSELLIETWSDGTRTIACRRDSSATWGPPLAAGRAA